MWLRLYFKNERGTHKNAKHDCLQPYMLSNAIETAAAAVFHSAYNTRKSNEHELNWHCRGDRH